MAAPVNPPGGLWAPAYRALVVGLVLTITLLASEALAIVTVMPIVARELGGLSLYGWVFSAFMLGSLVGIVVAGREADRRGPARPYAAGLVLFAAGLAVGGFAPTMEVLVLGRLLQGVGAGAVPAVAYVAIGRSLPPSLQPRMMAMLATAWVAPGIVGPALSAAVAHAFGWRWVFIGLLPLVCGAGVIALPALLRSRVTGETAPTSEHTLVDGLRVAAGAAMALAGISSDRPVVAVVLVAGGVALGVPALRRLLPVGTLRASPGLPATILVRGLLTFAFFGGDAFVTLAITTVRHRSTAMAGIVVTAVTLAWAGGAWVQAHVSERVEGRRLVRTGMVLLVGGLGGIGLMLLPAVPIVVGYAAWTLAGLGMGLAYAPISLMMLREAPPGREGWASASLNLSDVLGTALGTGIGGAAISVAEGAGWALSTGIAAGFSIAGAAALVGLAATRHLPLRGLDGALLMGETEGHAEPAIEAEPA